MIDYIDVKLVTISSILFIFYLLIIISKKEKDTFSVLMLFALPIINIYYIYSTYYTANENIIHFNDDGILKCNQVINIYKVSKQENWKLYNSYFVKNSLMIKANKCNYIQNKLKEKNNEK